MTKLCIHCKHFIERDCRHPNNMAPSMVTGEPQVQHTADYLRQPHSGSYVKCEPEAIWYEPIPMPIVERFMPRPDHDLDVCGRQLVAGS